MWWHAIYHVTSQCGACAMLPWHRHAASEPSHSECTIWRCRRCTGSHTHSYICFCRRFLCLAVRNWVKPAARQLPGKSTHTALHPTLSATVMKNSRLRELHARHSTPTVARLARSAVLTCELPTSPHSLNVPLHSLAKSNSNVWL